MIVAAVTLPPCLTRVGAAALGGSEGRGRGGGGGGGGGGGRGGPPGGGLGPGGLSGGGGGRNPFASTGTNRRYNLTFSISARNLLNTQNLAAPDTEKVAPQMS